MASINIRQLTKETERAINSLENLAYGAALENFNHSKNEMVEEFNNHVVTKEIESGPDGNNESNTLGGRGNLFSFIGFVINTDPIEPIRNALTKNTKLAKKAYKKHRAGKKVFFSFKVDAPDQQNLDSLAPIPWGSGGSWLRGIETTISGLGHYIYWKFFPQSRSTTGIQSKTPLRALGFKPIKYMSGILKNFLKKLS